MSKEDHLIQAKMVLDSTGFNEQISGVNQQLKLSRSELKATSTQLGVFGKDQDSLKATTQGLQRQIELQSQKVDIYRKNIENTTNKMNANIQAKEDLKRKLDSANQSYDQAIKLYGKESEEAKKAKESVDQLKEELKQKEKQVENNAKSINNYTIKLNQADAELANLQGELKKTNDELAKSESRWLNAGKALEETGEKLKSTGEKISGVGGTILKATALVVGLGAASLKFGIEFESAFAGVKKTVDTTEEELARLSKGIRDMSKQMPQTATEIAGVAEAAGQLGIEVPNILDFTETMVMLGDATNMSSNQAATSLARLANITGMSQENFDRLGSVIVALGNNLATTESEIVEMGLRLAGAGSQIGLTEAQILGFAGALSSVGIEAQAGGSAFSKVMVDIQLAVETGSDRLSEFAQVAGMSASEFAKAFKEDAGGALIAFVEGLGKTEEQGISAIKVLDDMEIKEVRLRDALLRASGASDVFKDSIKMGTSAWEENTALANEAAQRYETTESKLAMLKNQFIDAGIKLGDVLIPYVEKASIKVGEFADWLGQLDEETLETTAKIVGFTVALGGILKIGGGAISTIGSVAGGLGKLSTALGTAKIATAGIGTSASVAGGVGGLGALTAGLGTAVVAAAPFIAIGAGVAGAGYLVHKAMSEDAVPAVDLFADKIEQTATATETSNGRIYQSIETTVTKISEGTKEAVGAYLELDSSAKQHVDSIFINSTRVTAEMKDELVGIYNSMTETINSTLATKRDEDLANMAAFFDNSYVMTKAEEERLLQSTTDYYTGRQSLIASYEREITKIIETASNEKRKITEEEQKTINRLQQAMKEEAVKVLSENEVEAKIILERMKEYDTRITAEQAAEHVRILNQSRDEAIKAANEEYEERLATIIKMRDESRIISHDQAEKLIADAQRQRDGIIKSAEETRDGAVEKMKEMNSEIIKDIDLTDGSIKTRWQKLKEWFVNNPIVRFIKTIGGGDGEPEIGANWTGTNYWRGGLTTLHERGYEVYDLPRGTKVYNHDASEDLVRKTAEAVASKMISSNAPQGQGVNVTQHIYVPTSSPSEVARQTKNNLQQLALSF